MDGYEKALKALVVLILMAFLVVFTVISYRMITTDSSITGCYLSTGLQFKGERTLVMGRVEWGEDIRIGSFAQYEKAEEAMARYADCHVKGAK